MSLVTPDQFKQAMRALPAQVTVISTQTSDLRIAMTATAVTSLSADPPQLLVCIHNQARSAAAILQAGAFAVNLIPVSHVDIATQCALPGLSPEERFSLGNWTAGPVAGQPLLDGATVNFECRLASENVHGTHFVFVGLIESLRFSDGRPLLYHDASYREVGDRLDALHLSWDNTGLAF